MVGQTSFTGTLKMRVHRAPGPGLLWLIRNWLLRPSHLFGLLAFYAAKGFTKLTGIPTIVGQLEVTLRRADGSVVRYGVVSHRVVTTAGVTFLADDWYNASQEITNMKYHGSGTGVSAEANGDTALGAEVETRATGTQTKPTGTSVKSSGQVSYTGSRAITEHGLFSASSTGTLWDRSVFAAVNVGNGDAITFDYTCTLNAGG